MSDKTIVMICRACGQEHEGRVFGAREMLFGWRHRAEYGECHQCESLQLLKIPDNLAEYYPAEYYSFQPPPVRARSARGLRRAWANLLLTLPLAGAWVRRQRRKYPFFHWCRQAKCGLDAKILDLGCGSGGLLRRMQRYGFNDLTGVDPYTSIEADEPGFRVRRAELNAAGEGYDLIMLHHVLEHLIDPRQALEDAREKLGPRGKILVRIPVAGSHTARVYKENWFNLDPPRHLLVPSRRGMEMLANRSGLRVVRTEFDGIEAGFLISELYQQDIPYTGRPAPNPADVRRFRKMAEEANERGDGDQGVFFLERG